MAVCEAMSLARGDFEEDTVVRRHARLFQCDEAGVSEDIDMVGADCGAIGARLNRFDHGLAVNIDHLCADGARVPCHLVNVFLGRVCNFDSGQGEDVPSLRCCRTILDQRLDHELKVAGAHMVGYRHDTIPVVECAANQLSRCEDAIAEECVCMKVVHSLSL